MKKYFIGVDSVNEGDEPMYIKAAWFQISNGYLKFLDKDYKLIKEFEIHDELHMDNFNFNHQVKTYGV
jgi:hypothetical protein